MEKTTETTHTRSGACGTIGAGQAVAKRRETDGVFMSEIPPEFRHIEDTHVAHLKRIENFIIDHLEEVKNRIGGVIGYKLNLNDAETEQLMKIVKGDHDQT